MKREKLNKKLDKIITELNKLYDDANLDNFAEPLPYGFGDRFKAAKDALENLGCELHT